MTTVAPCQGTHSALSLQMQGLRFHTMAKRRRMTPSGTPMPEKELPIHPDIGYNDVFLENKVPALRRES